MEGLVGKIIFWTCYFLVVAGLVTIAIWDIWKAWRKRNRPYEKYKRLLAKQTHYVSASAEEQIAKMSLEEQKELQEWFFSGTDKPVCFQRIVGRKANE